MREGVVKRYILIDDEDETYRQDVTTEIESFASLLDILARNPNLIVTLAIGLQSYRALKEIAK